jgi:tartrate dehydratase beta subunit/fumarate hydratase class I family protein
VPNFGIKAMIMDFMTSRAGVPTSADLVAEEVNVTRQQAFQSLASLVKDGNSGVIRVSNGIYAYAGPSAAPRSAQHGAVAPAAVFKVPQVSNGSGSAPFTVVGKNKAGETLVRDANGVMYKLVEI